MSLLDAESANDVPTSRNPILAIGLPIALILIGHFTVDLYSSVVPPLLGIIEIQFQMTKEWTAVLFGCGAICSGLAQPTFAYLSDRLNNRIFGALGLILGAVFISCIGLISTQSNLFAFYCLGMMGIGMFHPIAASTMGRLAGDRRNIAISFFFVFGMAGWFTGSLLGPRLATGDGGLRNLLNLVWPGLIVAVVLHVAIRKIRHNAEQKESSEDRRSAGTVTRNRFAEYSWSSIGFLYFASATRFMVNLALVYLLVRWMQADVGLNHPDWNADRISDFAAPLVGRMNATLNVGMATGGLLAGFVIPVGRERAPMIWVPILFAPAVMGFGFFSPGWMGTVLGFASGIGFASMVPISISLGQRLMPFHTSLASGLMLGGAWALGSLGPLFAELVLKSGGLKMAFLINGMLLALSGFIAMGISSAAIQKK